MGDPEQFHGKSARGPLKILRCAQDDSVGAWIGVILMGAACDFMPEVHADGALWGRARKGWFSGTRVRFSMGACPKRVVFRHGVRFSLGSCPKRVVFRHRDPVFYGVVPEMGGFQVRYRLHSALPFPSLQPEDKDMQRCGRVQLIFVALQSEIVAL